MGLTEVEFNRKLFLARRRAEQQLQNDPLFYVTTLATTVITYKGLMMPAAIADFYTDLADERLKSYRCIPSTLFNQYVAALAIGSTIPLSCA